MNKSHKLIISIIISLLVLSLLSNIIFAIFLETNNNRTTKIFNNSLNSVVELKSFTKDYGQNFGTAVFISKDGYLLTAAHVITYNVAEETRTYEEYYIRFASDNDYKKVSLVKYDSKIDLAYLKLNNTKNLNIKAFNLSSKELQYGQDCFSIGNGLNQGIGITKGIISLPEVIIKYDNLERNLIQANIIINEGNSGGALLNNKGELIGITSFRIKDKNGSTVYGLGYFIPIKVIINFLNK